MYFLNKFFKKKKNQTNVISNNSDKTPVNESLDFITHQKTLKDEFGFLISEFGFKKSLNRWCSYEFTTVYSKDNIDIIIIFTSLSLPLVSIKNKKLPYDESKNLINSDIIEDFNFKVRSIRSTNQNRTMLFRQNFIRSLKSDKEYDSFELENDYINFGKNEHIELLKESAKTIRENITKQKGVIGKTTYS